MQFTNNRKNANEVKMPTDFTSIMAEMNKKLLLLEFTEIYLFRNV
jgi:hypothetical protein